MGTSTVPALIDALTSAADLALSDTNVFDGPGSCDDPGDYLMVGVDDPFNVTSAVLSASVEQVAGPSGTNRPRDESGTLWCSALSWNGDADQKVARDRVYAIQAAVENILRANPSLNIAAGGLFYAELGVGGSLKQDQGTDGAMAILAFPISFRARI
jgi:hypothetical protein